MPLFTLSIIVTTLKASPLGSLSFNNNLSVTLSLLQIVAKSSTATGASFVVEVVSLET